MATKITILIVEMTNSFLQCRSLNWLEDTGHSNGQNLKQVCFGSSCVDNLFV